jgi:hypothetical protein
LKIQINRRKRALLYLRPLLIGYFGLLNQSLGRLSPAELASVSIQQGNNQFEKLYFETVEKTDHVQN